jgi:hypothetical protein
MVAHRRLTAAREHRPAAVSPPGTRAARARRLFGSPSAARIWRDWRAWRQRSEPWPAPALPTCRRYANLAPRSHLLAGGTFDGVLLAGVIAIRLAGVR